MSEELDWKVPPEQPEGIRWRMVHAIIAGMAIIFGGGVLIVALMVSKQEPSINPSPSIPRVLGDPHIGIVNQTLFDLDMTGYDEREDQLQRLQSWGWVDQQRGLLHEPVDRAVDELLREHAAEPGGAP